MLLPLSRVFLPLPFRITNKTTPMIASFGNSSQSLKMVLVVRQDLKRGSGKIASQCAHAATEIYSELMESQRSVLRRWDSCGQAKIVVTCKNQLEMNKLKETAESIGLPTFVVADAGRTQVSSGSKTVLAIGPVYDFTSKLRGKLFSFGTRGAGSLASVFCTKRRKQVSSRFSNRETAPALIVLKNGVQASDIF